jgi:ABC-2 type transport system permease protein
MYEFFRFEIRTRLRQPAVYLFALLFALLAVGATASEAVQMGGAGGQTKLDSPYVIAQFTGVFCLFAVLIVTAFTSGAIVRDFETGAYELFYTRPIRKADYLLGRFAGGFVATVIVMVGAILGLAIGTAMPWVEDARTLGFSPLNYVQPLLVLAVPSLFVTGTIFFAIATLTRRMLWAYVSVAGFLVLYAVAQGLVADLDNDTIASLLDPFGLATMEHVMRYWTPAERNSELLPVLGMFGINRAIWIAIGIGFLGLTVAKFQLRAPTLRAKQLPPDHAPRIDPDDVPLPRVHIDHGPRSRLLQLLFRTRVEIRGVVSSTAYIVLAVFAAVNTIGGAYGTIDQLFGTPIYPVTHLMLRVIEGGLSLFLLIVITFYAGELVWRERKVGMHEVHDALPMPNWIPLLAKLAALLGAVALLIGVGMLTAIGLQLWRGYLHLELDLYVVGLFGVQFFDWALLCVVAIFFQVITNHRYAGYALVGVHFLVMIVLPSLDFDHQLYRYGSATDGQYSDMNGWGHFVKPMVWLRTYWGFVAMVLVLIANLLWVRGTDARFKLRLLEARRRVTASNTALLAIAVIGFFSTGAFVYWNTNVLNDYAPGDAVEDEQQRYEELYKQYEGLAQPRVVATELEVDLFPQERKLDVRGTMTLRNKTQETIETLHVRLDPDLDVRAFSLDQHTRELDDAELGYRIYRLAAPMAPGEELVVTFDVTWQELGFPNSGSNTAVVENGSFFHNDRYVPHFGYDPGLELSDPDERRERGLPEKPRMPALEDEAARGSTYISSEADWIDFKATVSTSADQIALAPGYLVDEWTVGERRFFRYEMDAPILNLYAFMSARYTVARDTWNDVAIEVYYHEPHHYNVERMIYAVKQSLDYCSTSFSPYQHRQMRIVEFPRYASFAQSLPNIVPYSESIGFIADLRDEEDIDYVFYVTAHEVAHQWWAHQVIGANVQGSTVMSETLAQYSALMVMEKEYGRDKMRKFLRHELDSYLAGRATERHRELPLVRVENQPYIHYNKGSLVMYALREYLGEDVVNRALSSYVKRVRFQEPPYTTSLELVDALREVTPPRYAYLIEDLFETITLYDNRAISAEAEELADGRWQIELVVQSRKFRADESGAETQVELADWIEIGVLDENDELLYRQEHQLDTDETTLTVVVDRKPARAGIDPITLLVDRDPDDNLREVTFE